MHYFWIGATIVPCAQCSFELFTQTQTEGGEPGVKVRINGVLTTYTGPEALTIMERLNTYTRGNNNPPVIGVLLNTTTTPAATGQRTGHGG